MSSFENMLAGLFDLKYSLAGPFLASRRYPWELLPELGQIIRHLASQLPSDYREIRPGVWVGPGARVAESAVFTGPAIVGSGSEVRPGAYVRQNVLAGEHVVIGHATEVKNAVLFDRVQVPHFNYVGDSILGLKAHLGAGAIISNFKSTADEIHIQWAEEKISTGLHKFGALVGDRVEIGCNAVLFPGTIVGKETIIYPLLPARGTIPAKVIKKNNGKTYRQDSRG